MMSKRNTNKTAINERIELLEKQSKLIQDELGGEVELAKTKIANIGKMALGIGGGLILSAIILKGIFGSGQKDGTKKHKPQRVYHKFRDQLVGEVSNQALEFVLGIAKDKINAFLEQDVKKDEDGPELTD